MTIRHSMFWSFSQQAGMMLMQFASIVIIARLLTPAEVGVFVIALAILTIVQSLREMGLSTYLIREPDLTDAAIRTTFGLSILLCGGIALTLFLLRGPLETWLNTPGLANVLLPVVFVVIIFPIEQPAMALIRRDMRFKALHNITIFSKFIGVMTSVAFALAGFSTMSLVWGLAIEALLRAVLFSYAERRPLRLGPSVESWRLLLGFGAWITGGNLAGQAYTEINKLLIGSIYGVAPAALYDRALRIPRIAAAGIFMPIGRVVMSSFSADLRNGKPIGPKVAQLIALTTAVAWPLFAVLIILSQEVILFVLGSQWGEAAQFLPWLLLQQMIMMTLLQPEQVLVPYGYVRLHFFLRIAHLVLAVVSGWIALQWGLWMFAVTRPPVMIITVLMTWFAIAPFVKLKKRALARIYLQSVLISASVALPVLLWKYTGIGGGSIGTLFASFGTATGFGIAMLYVLKHPLMDELIRLGKMIVARINHTSPF